MLRKSCLILVIVGLALASSSPIAAFDSANNMYLFEDNARTIGSEGDTYVRVARSPEGGHLDLGYTQDQNGRSASLDYNHNLWTSRDGSGSIDAYAQATRNFDWNHNDYGAGIRGSWRF